MDSGQLLSISLIAGAGLIVLTTYPYLATGIAYRDRDNGLSYILFLMGVAVWNGLFAVQALDSRPIVKGFFFSIATLGAVLAGLGWLLFASTASSTPRLSRRRLVYRVVALLAGIDITLAITTPTHSLYWTVRDTQPVSLAFTGIVPNVGYWLHTVFLTALFGVGAALFGHAWKNGTDVAYTRLYTIAGFVTAAAILTSSLVLPGTTSVAPIAAGSLTTIGWIQAQQKRYLRLPRPYRWLSELLR